MKKILLSVFASFLLLSMILAHAAGQEEVMEYKDPETDFIRHGPETGREDDVDILSITCDDSTFPVVLVLTVKGTITKTYGEDIGSNNYVMAIDLDGDESQGEVGLQLIGGEGMTIHTDDRTIPFPEEKYTIQGSTLTVQVDFAYFGNYEKVSDFTASTLQHFTQLDSSVSDSVNYIFGGDDKPYDRGTYDDDITTDDDISDDDAADDDTNDDDAVTDDDDSPAVPLILTVITVLSAALLIGRYRKR
jgi:hypothetical protein